MCDITEKDALLISFTISAFLGLAFASEIVLSNPERQNIPRIGF